MKLTEQELKELENDNTTFFNSNPQYEKPEIVDDSTENDLKELVNELKILTNNQKKLSDKWGWNL